MASVYRTFLEKLGGSAIGSFIGTKGDLFYDPEASPPELKVSDGVTAGGVSLPSGGGGGGQNNENSYKS